MMDRRAFIAGTFAVFAAPLAVEAQAGGKVARIGFLETGSLSAHLHGRGSFQERLRELWLH
jgi:hypothetical protein